MKIMTCAVILAIAPWGCRAPSEPEPTAPAAAASTSPASADLADPPEAPGGNGSGGGQGTGGGRFRQAAVYVDGTPLAVLKFGELPPGLTPTVVERTTSEGQPLRVQRFPVVEYLAALGLEPTKVREIHFYGGRQRIGVMPGAELSKYPKEIAFSFTQTDTGKPRMHWPKEVAVTDKIDMVNDMAVYVDKPPPVWNAERWRLELGGQPVEGIPYRTQEVGGGTRLYVDGRLARVIKPKSLEPAAGDRWPLTPQLASAGVALDQIKAVELVNNDVLAGRLQSADLAAATFTAVANARGRIAIEPGAVVTEVIRVYVRSAPPR